MSFWVILSHHILSNDLNYVRHTESMPLWARRNLFQNSKYEQNLGDIQLKLWKYKSSISLGKLSMNLKKNEYVVKNLYRGDPFRPDGVVF